ncbi:MAG: L,D-transpeptidase family protein [Nocardioides sp.]
MRRLVTVLGCVLAALPWAGPAAAAHSVTLGGVSVRLTDRTGQVVTVNRTRGYHAVVSWWIRTDSGWERQLRSRDGRVGYGGLVLARKRKQGTGTTPLGTFRLPWAFGTHRRQDAWMIRYRRIKRGDYWVQDNRSAYYNRYRNRSAGGFRWWLPGSDPNSSERLKDYPRQYEWAVVTSFNKSQVKHRGSGIFLHVNGPGATGGCVSAPRRLIRRLMRRLDPAQRPVIAVGR